MVEDVLDDVDWVKQVSVLRRGVVKRARVVAVERVVEVVTVG